MTNPTYMAQMYTLAVALAAKTPAMLWGPPGVGKTTILQQLADQRGIHQETVIAAIHGPDEFNGLPVVNQSEGTVSMAPPAWAQRIADNGGGRVFLDELSNAMPSVQAAVLRPLLENVVGDLSLPKDNMGWVAAANPPDTATDGYEMRPALANRFLHIDWQMPNEVIADGFMFGWPEVPTVEFDPERYEAARADLKVKVGTFLSKVNPALGLAVPDGTGDDERAWPSPRSWDQTVHLLAVADSSDIPSEYMASVRTLLVTGSIGNGAGLEFAAWERQMDLPDPETLLADPMGWEVPTDLDKVYAITGSVLAAYERNPSPERWIAAGDVFGRVAEAGYADLCYLPGQRWSKIRPNDANVIPSTYSMEQMAGILVSVHAAIQGN